MPHKYKNISLALINKHKLTRVRYYHFSLMILAKIKEIDDHTVSAGARVGWETATPIHCWWKDESVSASFLEDSLVKVIKKKIFF